jgi:hypothetical protein
MGKLRMAGQLRPKVWAALTDWLVGGVEDMTIH